MLEGRDWLKVDGATATDLERLRAIAPRDLPKRYVDLLEFSNGGEGPLPINPYNLCLDPVKAVVDRIVDPIDGSAKASDFLIFGGNGSGEYLAFDLRGGSPWPIVTMDMVAGGDSAKLVAIHFDAFFDLIGAEANGS